MGYPSGSQLIFDMKTIIEAVIEKTSDGYNVYTPDEMFSGVGNTADEAKADLLEQIKFYTKTCKETGHSYPKFLDGVYEVIYKFNTQSLLRYYTGIFTNASLERMTGINQKQLWSYASGKTKPRPQQVKKIEKALHRLGKELMIVSLSE